MIVVMGNYYFKFLIFFGFVIVQSIGRSQNYLNYYNIRNEALHAFKNQKFNQANIMLDSAFELAEPLGKDLFLKALILTKLNRNEESYNYLKLSVISKKGMVPVTKDSLENKDFKLAFGEEKYKKLCDTLNTIWDMREFNILNNPVEKKILNIVDSFIKQDQSFRSNYTGYLNNEELELKRMESDKILHIKFINFISEYGWPQHSSELLTTILIHFTYEEYLLYKDIIFSQVKFGNLDPFWFASMEERINIIKNPDYCKYGIWNKNCDTNEIRINRLEIGMDPILNGPFRNHRN